MKKEISPAIAGVIIVVILLLAGGIYFLTNRSGDGARPTAEQAAQGPTIGGKRLPMSSPSGGGGISSPGTKGPD